MAVSITGIGSTFPQDVPGYFTDGFQESLRHALVKAITAARAGNDTEATALIALLAAADAELDTAVA